MAIIAGKSSEVVGNKDSTLILRGSSVKIQWGNKFIDELAIELKISFPSIKGFSVRNLKNMKKKD